MNIFLPIIFNICFGCSKEPSHWDGSFEFPQHMFWLRNKKLIFLGMHSKLKSWWTSLFIQTVRIASLLFVLKYHIEILHVLKESAIHRNRWYNLKDYIVERICKQRNCLKSIYSINYHYFKFTKFALESAWGSRHVFTPVTSLTHIDFLVGLPCARSACVLTKLAVHLYWNFDLISEKNSSRVW